MRTIKFRGKDIKTGEWVMGDLHLFCDKPHIHTAKSSYPFAGQRSFVAPETIGQFTGLLDKNGREIYEGDILNIWCGGYLQANPYVVNDMCELFASERDDSYYRITKMEIIGNITDNPELLKGGE